MTDEERGIEVRPGSLSISGEAPTVFVSGTSATIAAWRQCGGLAAIRALVLKVALGLVGVLMGLIVSILVLAAMGYAFYIVVRVLSPSTAERIRQAIRGTPRSTPSEGGERHE